jgi:hypothetical protein
VGNVVGIWCDHLSTCALDVDTVWSLSHLPWDRQHNVVYGWLMHPNPSPTSGLGTVFAQSDAPTSYYHLFS